jgi:hypothetical protein
MSICKLLTARYRHGPRSQRRSGRADLLLLAVLPGRFEHCPLELLTDGLQPRGINNWMGFNPGIYSSIRATSPMRTTRLTRLFGADSLPTAGSICYGSETSFVGKYRFHM